MKNIIPKHLIEKGIAVELDNGIYTYREPFVNILQFADEYFSQCFAEFFDAEEHYYPVITPVKLVETGSGDEKFGSRLLFVSHLKESLDIIADFTRLITDNGGWNKNIDISDKLKKSEYVFNPLCSYHIFETVKQTKLSEKGLSITTQTKCFLEYSEKSSFAQLRDFTIREFVTLGSTENVNKNIALFKKLFEKILTGWGLDYNCNDNGSQICYSVFNKDDNASLLICECNLADSSLCEAFGIECEKSGLIIIYLEALAAALLQNKSDINNLTDEFKASYSNWSNAFGLNNWEKCNEYS